MDEPLDLKPSRSARRREALDVTALAHELVAMKAFELEALDLPDVIRELVAKCQRIRAPIAHRREVLYLAKQLRDIELSAIRDRARGAQSVRRADAAAFHRVEHWRDRLLESPASASEMPAIDPGTAAELTATAIKAQAERAAGRAPRHSRELFQAIKQVLEEGAAD